MGSNLLWDVSYISVSAWSGVRRQALFRSRFAGGEAAVPPGSDDVVSVEVSAGNGEGCGVQSNARVGAHA